MPRLFRVIVPVGDIEGAATFYGSLLGLSGQRVSPGRHYFDCEGTILACYDPRADGDERDARPLDEPIYIAVDDIEVAFERAGKSGATFSPAVVPDVGALGKIAVRPWGERSFYAVDPFGNAFCMVARDTMFGGAPSPEA